MPDDRSSNPKGQRLSGVHLVATSFAAVAGVALAAWQLISPPPPTQPVQVTVAVAPTAPGAPDAGAAAAVEPAKADATISGQDLAAGAQFSAALNDGVDQRYQLGSLFDGKADTFLTLAGNDREINVLVTFAGNLSAPVKGLEYTPPAGAGAKATTVDVAVLPAGTIEAAGLPIHSFTLPGGEAQSFTLPAPENGKAVWLRISADVPTANLVVGDFRIIAGN